MLIKNSILAGEILSVLEKSTCSIRIIDIEIIFQISKKDACSAITILMSEELVDLLNEDGRIAVALRQKARAREYSYQTLKSVMALDDL